MRALLAIVGLAFVVACPGKNGGVRPAVDAAEAAVILYPAAGGSPSRVAVELARTDAEWQRGLMFRQRLDEGRGMLFVGQAPEQRTFWMRNTLIPLDMIFITAELRVLGVVENATPLTDDPRSVPGLSLHVLEVPGGWSRKNGVGAGAQVQLENVH